MQDRAVYPYSHALSGNGFRTLLVSALPFRKPQTRNQQKTGQPQEDAGWSYSQTVLVRKAPSLTLLVKKGEMGAVLRAGSVSDGLTHLTELPQELSASKRSREGRRQSPASFSGRRVSVLLRGGVVKFSLKLRTG